MTCFIDDPVGLQLRDRIGIDNMAWEADYPHPDGMWPSAPEELHSQFAQWHVSDDEARKIGYENALRWYSFDPFSHIPKARATVGALRRAAGGHDVSTMSGAERKATPDARLTGHRERAEKALALARA